MMLKGNPNFRDLSRLCPVYTEVRGKRAEEQMSQKKKKKKSSTDVYYIPKTIFRNDIIYRE